MNKEEKKTIEIEGSVRKFSRPSLFHNIRRLWLTRNLKLTGRGVYIESNVKFIRHPRNISIGNNVILKEGSRICPANPEASVIIGDWTTIGYHCFIFSSIEINIGKNCLIAPFCYLVDANHGIKKEALIRTQKMSASPIVIGDDVWLGADVKVLSGVTVGTGAIVGAGSVVNQDIPPYAIAAGIPAKVIRYRE